MKTKTDILNKFLSRKGQICTIHYEKNLKTRKGFAGSVVKREVRQARPGVNYSNVAEVKESGREVQSLPYGEWEIFPHTIIHNGQRYLRFRSLKNGKKSVEYFVNGSRVSEGEAKEICLKSEFKDDLPIVFNLKEENVKDII